MAQNFELDVSGLRQLMARSPQAAAKGGKKGLHKSLDDWVIQAKDIAPIDKGILRGGIKSGGVKQSGQVIEAKIKSIAMEKNFDYAYYIHELDAGGKNVGGVHQYLDKSAEANKDEWLRWIEQEIRNELNNAGW
jgi:hypothetical protein